MPAPSEKDANNCILDRTSSKRLVVDSFLGQMNKNIYQIANGMDVVIYRSAFLSINFLLKQFFEISNSVKAIKQEHLNLIK